jgi:hypothetical protein
MFEPLFHPWGSEATGSYFVVSVLNIGLSVECLAWFLTIAQPSKGQGALAMGSTDTPASWLARYAVLTLKNEDTQLSLILVSHQSFWAPQNLKSEKDVTLRGGPGACHLFFFKMSRVGAGLPLAPQV